jgi:hypothetical protein
LLLTYNLFVSFWDPFFGNGIIAYEWKTLDNKIYVKNI